MSLFMSKATSLDWLPDSSIDLIAVMANGAPSIMTCETPLSCWSLAVTLDWTSPMSVPLT